MHRIIIVIVLLSTLTVELTPTIADAVSSTPQVQLEQITSVDFSWYKFLIVGNSVNFTAKVSGGAAPYSFSWDFGDGQTATVTTAYVFHTYSTPGNLTVTLTVTDSLSATGNRSKDITVLSWPTPWSGWLIRHNITANDGVSLWDVTYNGKLVIRDARLAGIVVRYKENFCTFYDEPEDQYTDVGTFEYGTVGSDPYLQIRTMSIDRSHSLVGGYWYQQAWRFYASGRWDAIAIVENGGGCGADHYYEAHWRFDLSLGDGSHEFMGQYTPSGMWRNLLWESSYPDNGLRDTAHNMAQWRFTGNQTGYYLTPSTTIQNPNKELPSITSRVYLVKSKPNEVELTPSTLFNMEDPLLWVNSGELAFNRDLAFWFLGSAWVHAPMAHVPSASGNMIILSLYPDGL